MHGQPSKSLGILFIKGPTGIPQLVVKMKEQRIQHLVSEHILCLVLWLILGHTFATGQLLDLGFHSSRSPCDSECECFSWNSSNGRSRSSKRFTVNCTGMKFDLFQGVSVPKNLPLNTTDLVVKDYHLGTVGLNSFDNNPFPLNPMLLTLVLSSCHITFLSRETFEGNSLISLETVDLSYNHMMLIQEGTFSHLPSLELILLSNNFLEEAQQGAFRNLPKARMINLSHNALHKIYPETFDRVPELKILDLSANWLRNLPWKNISQLTSLQVLRLEGNFWNCSCDMADIIYINQSLIAGSKAVCRSPNWLNGTLLEQLSSKDFSHCFSDEEFSLQRKIAVTLLFGAIFFLLMWWGQHSNRPKSQMYQGIGQIEFNVHDVLGQSGCVYKGRLKDGREAAIKRYPGVNCKCKELEILLRMSEKGSPHANVVQYFCVEYSSNFTYLALELCHGNLMTALNDHSEQFAVYLEPRNCFSQITSGLSYLHGIGIQHRDIKPQNILWKSMVSDLRFVLSDFDLGHITEEESLHKTKYGSLGWCAPELWNLQDRTDAVDIFSLGCVFYFVLTRGEGHPFGLVSDMEGCQRAIISQDYHFSLSGLQDSYQGSLHMSAIADDLLREMICFNPNKRIKASEILKHPLLWNSAQMLTFSHDIGDCIEGGKDPDIVAFKEMLESGAGTVFVGSWMDQLDPLVRSDVQGFYKQRDKLCALLRVVRNKIEHFQKLGNQLREFYFGSREGVVQYYVNRFPKLLSFTYRTLKRSGFMYHNGLIKTESSLM